MRRSAALLLGMALLLPSAPFTGAAAGVRASTSRAAGAEWWVHDGETGELISLYAYEYTRADRGTPPRVVAALTSIPCKVGRRDRPEECEWRQRDTEKLKVDVFDMDPLLDSARIVVHKGSQRGEITLEGDPGYYPFVFQHLNQFAVPPYFAHVSAGVTGYLFRTARAKGDLFGMSFTRKQFIGGVLVTAAGGYASSHCISPYCVP